MVRGSCSDMSKLAISFNWQLVVVPGSRGSHEVTKRRLTVDDLGGRIESNRM